MSQSKTTQDQHSPIISLLRKYHRHQVVGIERVPKSGRCLLVANHSFATYDLTLLFHAIRESHQRIARPLAHRGFFRSAYSRKFIELFGAVEGHPDQAKTLLAEEQLVAVAPGGLREMLKPSTERYQLQWEDRKGFARLAILTGTPIVLAVCPRADDIFEVYPNPITKIAYRRFHFPVVLARGLGPTLFPRPIKLIHHIGEPIAPPAPEKSKKKLEAQVEQLHRTVCKKAEFLIGKAIAYRQNRAVE